MSKLQPSNYIASKDLYLRSFTRVKLDLTRKTQHLTQVGFGY